MSETEGAVGVEEVSAPVSEGTQPQTKKRKASENGLHILQKNGSVDDKKNVDESYFSYVLICLFCASMVAWILLHSFFICFYCILIQRFHSES